MSSWNQMAAMMPQAEAGLEPKLKQTPDMHQVSIPKKPNFPPPMEAPKSSWNDAATPMGKESAIEGFSGGKSSSSMPSSGAWGKMLDLMVSPGGVAGAAMFGNMQEAGPGSDVTGPPLAMLQTGPSPSPSPQAPTQLDPMLAISFEVPGVKLQLATLMEANLKVSTLENLEPIWVDVEELVK